MIESMEEDNKVETTEKTKESDYDILVKKYGKNSQLSEYEEFLKKYFLIVDIIKEYDLLYKRVCSFNIFIEILKSI